ncbi:hypothetical protein HDU67_003720, partial [Dinochytrium kinnereticum]
PHIIGPHVSSFATAGSASLADWIDDGEIMIGGLENGWSWLFGTHDDWDGGHAVLVFDESTGGGTLL